MMVDVITDVMMDIMVIMIQNNVIDVWDYVVFVIIKVYVNNVNMDIILQDNNVLHKDIWYMVHYLICQNILLILQVHHHGYVLVQV